MTNTSGSQQIPIEIVGSSTFGRYETVSASRTYNMFITTSGDGKEQWLVNFAGYESVKILIQEGTTAVGRGIFHSIRGDFLLAIVGTSVFRINNVDSPAVLIGSLLSSTGEVSIDENLASQICIVDGTSAYIYNYGTGGFGLVSYNPISPDFSPNYVTFQNGFFLFGNANKTSTGNTWFVYRAGISLTLEFQAELALETKPDYALAVIPIPGHANSVLVLGTSVAEIWVQTGSLATYQRNQSLNIDYGCASVSTIAASDTFIAWLAINEKSSPSIMVMAGGQAQRISSDGIDNLMDTIQFPEDSTGFFFRQDGHLFYVLTFFNAVDNITLTYDFTTEKFFDLTDWDYSYFPARQVAYYRQQLYFVSLKDTKLYDLGTDITQYITYPGLEEFDIPRIRLTDTFRLPTPEKFRINLFTFVIESGTTPGVSDIVQCSGYILNEETSGIIYTEDDLPLLIESGYCGVIKPRVDLTISKDGGITWSNTVPYDMHATGKYQSQPRFNRLGTGNNITFQLRFWNQGRVVVKNGAVEVSP
jgi:hypothetical protein